MKRRTFIKVSGIALAGQALGAATLAAPASATLWTGQSAASSVVAPIVSTRRLSIAVPGAYQITGLVRLHTPRVEIRGISNTQSISWSAAPDAELPLTSFTTFETIETANATSEIRVLGGSLEAISVTPVEAA